MRDLGERNDVIKAINRALADRGEERAPEALVLHGEDAQTPIIGRVIDKIDGRTRRPHRTYHRRHRRARASRGVKAHLVAEG